MSISLWNLHDRARGKLLQGRDKSSAPTPPPNQTYIHARIQILDTKITPFSTEIADCEVQHSFLSETIIFFVI